MSDDINENTETLGAAIAGLSKGITMMDKFMAANMQRGQQNNRQEDKQTKAISQRLREFDKSLFSAEQDLRAFSASGDSAVDFLKQFANQGRGFIGLGLFSILASSGNQLSKSWQDLSNIGQTFGGSMFTMLESASDAGLSLDEFSSISKRSNLVIKATNGNFFKMQKELRRVISASGSYGFTVEQVNEFMGENLEVSRRNGTLQHRSSQQVVADMGDLMNTTTALANASDKTREEIMNLASAAMGSALSIAQIANTPVAIRGIVDKSVREATMGFAALPGEAGDFFSKFFNDTLGASSALTAQGQTLIDAGMSGLASEMDMTAQKFRGGNGGIDDYINYTNKIVDTYKANLPALQGQAAGGNEAAKQFMTMAAALSKMTRAELERNKAANDNSELATAFFASLNSVFGILKGSFIAGFIKGFGKVFGKMASFADSPAFKNIERVLEELGAAFGKSIGGMLISLNPETIKATILGIIDGLTVLGGALVVLAQVAGSITKAIGWAAGLVTGIFGSATQSVAKWSTILLLGGWAVYKMFKGMMSLRNLFKGSMTVNARTVNVNGGVGGGVSDGLGDIGGGVSDGLGDIGGGKGKRGRMRRMRAGARSAGRRGGSRLGGAIRGAGLGKGLVKGLLKGGLKSGLKKIPVLGALAGLGFAGGRLLSGDYLGAGGELASGIAGAFPGLGTVASLAIDGSLAARDAKLEAGAAPAAPTARVAPKTMAAMAGLGGVAALAGAPKPAGPDPMQIMIEELRRQTTIMTDTMSVMTGKLEQANRLLSKIEVSAQGI